MKIVQDEKTDANTRTKLRTPLEKGELVLVFTERIQKKDAPQCQKNLEILVTTIFIGLKKKGNKPLKNGFQSK